MKYTFLYWNHMILLGYIILMLIIIVIQILITLLDNMCWYQCHLILIYYIFWKILYYTFYLILHICLDTGTNIKSKQANMI